MSNELAINVNVPAVKEDASIDALTKTADYLPQLRVYGASNDLVKEGEFPMGHLGLYYSKDKIVDLGEQSDFLVLGWRPRASIFSGDQPISYYGRIENDEWVYSDSFSETKDRAINGKEQGFMAGLEYLLWVPSVKAFCLFFMGNPTLRRESPNLKALTADAATVKVKLIKGKKHTWHGVEVLTCKTPFDTPSQDSVNEETQKFYSPKDSDVELDSDEESTERAR